jgi:hypothetical protein
MLKEMVRRKFADAIDDNERFIFVSHGFLGASIAQDVLHRGGVYSIVRSFEAQIVFDERATYLAVLAGLRVHNRLGVAEVLEVLGPVAVRFPRAGLCFAGPTGAERWRDCTILAIEQSGPVLRPWPRPDGL